MTIALVHLILGMFSQHAYFMVLYVNAYLQMGDSDVPAAGPSVQAAQPALEGAQGILWAQR